MQSMIRQFGPMLSLAAMLFVLGGFAASQNALDRAPPSVFVELPSRFDEPTVSVTAEQAPSGAWYLALETSGFAFTEICLSEAHAIPKGHAHIIKDGVKIAAAYQPYAEIGALPPGRHHFIVTLQSQDHRAILGRAGLIKAEVTVDIPHGYLGV